MTPDCFHHIDPDHADTPCISAALAIGTPAQTDSKKRPRVPAGNNFGIDNTPITRALLRPMELAVVLSPGTLGKQEPTGRG